MSLFNDLKELLEKDERLVSNDDLLKNKIVELALKLDENLIKLLKSDKKIKEHFFKEIDDVLVFDKEKFMKFVDNKEYLPDSYTAFKNKIGLTADKEYLAKNKEVVLSWPYKDCVLEGGQEKEDEKRKEIFHNKILAPDESDRLLDPKVFTNFKRIDAKGEHDIEEVKSDDNLIIKGNNLLALHSLKKKYAGKVKLIYIDPPYNTGNDSFKYNDNFKRSTWLTFMKNRLKIAKDLLSDDGSIYIQIDSKESHYLKILLDEIFGRDNFRSQIIWDTSIPYVAGFKWHSNNWIYSQSTIFYYAKNKEKVFFNKQTFDVKQPSGDISKKPRKDVWTDIKNFAGIFGVNEIKLNFNTRKPEKLIKRILLSSSKPEDIVLDFQLGSGTTCAVAHKMGRQYIGIEQMDYANDISIKRLKEVIKGEELGISKDQDVNWEGGGDFIYTELKELNEEFVQKIKKSKKPKKLLEIWEEMKENSFLSYRVDEKLFDENIDGFKEMDLNEQKKLLLECLDYNNLYVNYSEIEDKQYDISKEEKDLNKKFYGEL